MCILSVFSVLLSWATSMYSYGDELRLLRRRGPSGSISCCPQGPAGQGGSRCLERLLRNPHPSRTHAACAAVAGTNNSIFYPLSGVVSPRCGESGAIGNEVAIRANQYRVRGWWQNGPPNYFSHSEVLTYPGNQIAAGSPRCEHYEIGGQDPPGWQQARSRCQETGYQGVHLYVSIDSELNHVPEVLRLNDPWMDDPFLESNVRVIQANSPRELKRALARLLMECRVVDFLFVGSHGQENQVIFGNNENRDIGQFLGWTVEPCIFSQQARVQFGGCSIACSPYARQVRDAVQAAFQDQNLIPAGNPNPFSGVRFLFHTDFGYDVSGGNSNFMDLLLNYTRRVDVESENGIGLEYSFQGNRLITDIPLEDVPRCPN